MKTAISLPDVLFKSADKLAKRLGLSRSELYARALEEYVAKHRGRKVTARLNQVYSTGHAHLESAVCEAQARSIETSEW